MMGLGFGVRPAPDTTADKFEWECYDRESGLTIWTGLSNREAWREADRRMNENKSRAESVSEWAWKTHFLSDRG